MEGRPLAEDELVEQARLGNIDAYEELIRTHQALALRAAYVVTGDRTEAEDVAQEAFIKAFYALGRFRQGAPFRPWLLRIVTNEGLNRRRSAGRRTALALKAAGRGEGGTARSPGAAASDPSFVARSAESEAIDADRDRRLLHAISQLKEKDRLVIGYRFFLDLPEAEIADALGCARGTVKSRLSRALERLRALYPEDDL